VMPTQFVLFGVGVNWLSPLYGVFIISTTARALVAIVLLPKLREVRSVRPITLSQVIFRVTRMNALAGLMFDIISSRPKSDRPSDEAGPQSESMKREVNSE